MSKNEFLKRIEIEKPCSQDWDEMTGNDEVRFCGHCSKNVNNLSAMTRKKALKIVREAGDGICVRYMQNPVDKTPVFSDKLYQITRRAGIAAGVLGASLMLSSVTYAQGGVISKTRSETEISQTEKSDEDKIGSASSTITGTITDPQGAVIPNIVVMLSTADNLYGVTAVSNEEGVYEFKNIPSGTFNIIISGNYAFKSIEMKDISVSENDKIVRDIQMDINESVGIMGLMLITEYSNPLHRAVSQNDEETVTELIARGENVNAKDEFYYGITPLFLAVENGNTAIAEKLLNFGAKVNARDWNRQTPLMKLDDDAAPEIVRLLIKHGAKINLMDKDGNTPLISAAERSTGEVVRELIDNGAKVDLQNNEGKTALMRAAYNDDLEKVKILLLAGANVNLKNKAGSTAWDEAGSDEIENLLESYGAIVSEDEN